MRLSAFAAGRLSTVVLLLGMACVLSGCQPSDSPGDAGNGAAESTGPVVVRGQTYADLSLSDGTRLMMVPILPGNPVELTKLTLSKAQNDVDLSPYGIRSAAYMRTVTFDSFDPVAQGARVCNIVPTLTFPRGEIAGVDASTLTGARIGDLQVGDETRYAHVAFLPARLLDGQGTLIVADYLFPDSIASDLAMKNPETAKSLEAREQSAIRPRQIRYVVGSFAGSANWSVDPALVLMEPSAGASEARIPATGRPANAPPLQTVVILVHGHNEKERLGYETAEVGPPWQYAYKRDVWTHLYKAALETRADKLECTAFYEFIYPTYRPIFTETSGVKRLDHSFAEAVNAELGPLVAANPDLRVYIVAHSMGGVVSRAGIQLLNSPIQKAFKLLITWGTPHLGSPLTTLRYVLGAPHGAYRAGPDGVVTFPLENIDNTLFALRRAIDDMAVDSPGLRDLRWANSHTSTPHNLALEKLFTYGESIAGDDTTMQVFDLENGPYLYSDNLRTLNSNDIYRLSYKYFFFYGVTSKRPKVTVGGFWFRRPKLEGGETAIGALVMPWLMADPNSPFEAHLVGDSDGAVPIASMAGAGVGPAGGGIDLGDLDHEQYFGSPRNPGQFTEPALATDVALQTLAAIEFATCSRGRWMLTDTKYFSQPAAAASPYTFSATAEGGQAVTGVRWTVHVSAFDPELGDISYDKELFISATRRWTAPASTLEPNQEVAIPISVEMTCTANMNKYVRPPRVIPDVTALIYVKDGDEEVNNPYRSTYVNARSTSLSDANQWKAADSHTVLFPVRDGTPGDTLKITIYCRDAAYQSTVGGSGGLEDYFQTAGVTYTYTFRAQ